MNLETTYNINSSHGIELSLKETQEGKVFTASGFIWNERKTDYTSCGQMLEELALKFPANQKVQRITAIWRDWHLNDMKPGTEVQEALVKGLPYEKACEVLEEADLLYDNGYMYGSSWLFREIPKEILAEIESWFV